MKSRPTYDSLLPVEIGKFNRQQRRYDIKRAQWDPAIVPLPAAFDAKTMVLPTAVAAIRKAFTLAKTGHRGWKAIQREGRFDVRQAPRISRGAQDVFKRKVGRSTTRVKVSVLLDASGSMNFEDATLRNPGRPEERVTVRRRMAAAVFGATIAQALGTVPTVDLDVFEHGAGFGDQLTIKWRWSKGTPVAVFNETANRGLRQSGNADGHALYAVTERLAREIRRDERGIIMVVSDGLPSIYSTTGTVSLPTRLIGESEHHYEERCRTFQAGQALVDAVAHARKRGFEVIAVAIDGSDQSVYYGPQGVIRFTGDWNALGSALARHVGAAMADR